MCLPDLASTTYFKAINVTEEDITVTKVMYFNFNSGELRDQNFVLIS